MAPADLRLTRRLLAYVFAHKRLFVVSLLLYPLTAASVVLRHTIDTPFTFDTKDYAASKANLVGYMGRMKERFGI